MYESLGETQKCFCYKAVSAIEGCPLSVVLLYYMYILCTVTLYY